ncbi:MAG: hypothetical protein ACI4XA_03860 [Oscillospiraceae bacterium]
MRKMMIAAAAGVLLLCGCSAGSGAVIDDNGTVRIESAGIGVELPDGWTAYVGEEVYEQVFESYSFKYSDVNEMKKAFDAEGQKYIAYALSDDDRSLVVVSAQDITTDTDGEKLDEPVSTADYARSVHDNTIFEYRASGYMTENSSFSEVTFGGKSGWLSSFDVTQNDEEYEYLFGLSDFMFREGDYVYCVELVYSDDTGKQQAAEILDGISQL